MRDIAIVIVSWRVKNELRECLRSIASFVSPELSINTIVVDNNSGDGTVEMVQDEFPGTRLIKNEKNYGFGVACNQGVAMSQSEFILFLNPDAQITSGALLSMIKFMRAQPFVGILGPKLINESGKLQPSARRFPTWVSASLLLTKLHRIFSHSLPLRRYYMSAFKYKTLREVDQLMGACLFVRRSVFEELNGFDEKFFIWFEEVDFCKRATEAGHIVFFFPEAIVKHRKGRSFTKRSILWSQWQFVQSMRKYFWKHHNVVSAGFITMVGYLSLIPAVIIWLFKSLGLKTTRSVDINR